jgi:hypothetical protein
LIERVLGELIFIYSGMLHPMYLAYSRKLHSKSTCYAKFAPGADDDDDDDDINLRPRDLPKGIRTC